MSKENFCCFTGHRYIALSDMARLKPALHKEIEGLIAQGVTRFITGGALGFDTMAALCVLGLKNSYDIRLILMLPCKNQTDGWTNAKNIEVYNDILNKADEVHYISESYDKGCMFKRNRAMVDSSAYCIAYCTKAVGGSAYTVNYAKEKGIKVINLSNKNPV